MADTPTTINAALKEAWPYSRVQKQFYNENSTLAELKKRTPKVQLGEAALVPIELNPPGGYSAVSGAGSDLNDADQLHLAQASYNLTHHHAQLKIAEAAIVRTDNANAIADVIDLAMTGATDTLRRQLSRQAFGSGDALMVQCDTTSAATTVVLNTEAGQSALERGFLYVGLPVDIGTTADQIAVAGNRKISAVSASTGTPSIVITGGAVTTSSSHYVSIAGARAGTTSYEMNGFRNLISGSGIVGGINASTYPTVWASHVDSTNTAITTDLLLQRQRAVLQATGQYVDWAIFPPKQLDRFYTSLQQQVRFSDDAVRSGGIQRSQWNGMTLNPEPDCARSNVFLLKKDDIFILQNGDERWQNAFSGNGKVLDWVPGTDYYAGKVSAHLNVALKRTSARRPSPS